MSAPTSHPTHRTSAPSPASGASGTSSVRYRCRDFIDDEQRLIAAIEKKRPRSVSTIADIDGRKLVVPLRHLRDAAGPGHDAEKIFSEKYGGEAGSSCFSRFRLVLDYLEERQEEILDAGLADEGDPFAVREEFVRFLLDCEIDEQRQRIPEGALYRFLDEWGLRWM